MVAEVVISVRDLYYKYPTSKDWVLNGVNLDIYKDEFLGLVGNTGAGKTTICQCFNGLIPHYTGGTFQGEVRVRDKSATEASVADLSSQIGLVFQDADAQLVMSSVLEEVMLGLTMREIPSKKARDIAMATLEAIGIQHLADRPPYALSGGQKQRVAIAAVLAMKPDVLVLDEATSELDSLTVHKIFAICKELNQNGTTIVLVSHEMELLSQYASRLILVDDGRILLEGSPQEVFKYVNTFQQVSIRLPQVTEMVLSLNDIIRYETLPLDVDETRNLLLMAHGDSH